MDEKDENGIDETEDNIIAATNIAEGMTYPIAALALALIDNGAVEVGRLRDIIESLRTIREAEFEMQYGVLEEATLGLDRLDRVLGMQTWERGRVVELLRLHETAEAARSLLHATLRKPPETE